MINQWPAGDRGGHKRPGFTMRERDTTHCPKSHPIWHYYYKQIDNETIICCKECEKSDSAPA